MGNVIETMERSKRFLKMLTMENERLTEQLGSMIRTYSMTNKMYAHYIYCNRPNNWLKRHGLPMRRGGHNI